MSNQKDFNWRPWLATIFVIIITLTPIIHTINGCQESSRRRAIIKEAKNDVPVTPAQRIVYQELNSKLKPGYSMNSTATDTGNNSQPAQNDTATKTVAKTDKFPEIKKTEDSADKPKAGNPPTVKQPTVKQDKQTPNERNFLWSFNNHNYKITLKLNPKLNQKYQDTKSFKGDDFNNYLIALPDDKIIKKIKDELLWQAYLYPGTDPAELIMSFIQSIPYDYDKEKTALATQKIDYLTPYQVLYQNKATCLEKSLLAIAVLREFGYGCALFLYQNIPGKQYRHAAVGIQCTKDDALKDTDYYCYASTSANNKIGVIPNKEFVNPIIKLQTKGKPYARYRKNNPNT